MTDTLQIAGAFALIGVSVTIAFLSAVALFWFLMTSRWPPVLRARKWFIGPEQPPKG